jgi:hypothetical protein
MHLLMWYGHGFSFSDILEMTPKEREWFVKRLGKQYKEDAKQARRK